MNEPVIFVARQMFVVPGSAGAEFDYVTEVKDWLKENVGAEDEDFVMYVETDESDISYTGVIFKNPEDALCFRLLFPLRRL